MAHLHSLLLRGDSHLICFRYALMRYACLLAGRLAILGVRCGRGVRSGRSSLSVCCLEPGYSRCDPI